jgi:hypothetical protein
MDLKDLELLEGDYETLVETIFEKGWTDGLAVTVPTPELVERMLDGRDPDVVIGPIPPLGLTATFGAVAVNAVLAGCAPEHFPLVEASVRAVLQPLHNINGVTCTTHMCVPLLIVNGPQRERLGFISTDGVFGSGSRANGAVGRALRLIIWNLGGARPGGEDKSTLSHPGEWTYCIAEDEEGSPWEPLHVEHGMQAGSDAVSAFACEGPHSVVAIGTPEAMLDRILGQLVSAGNNNTEYRFGPGGQALITVNAEQAERFAADGWTKQNIKEHLWEKSRSSVREILEWGDPYSSEIGVRNGFLAQGQSWSDWNDPDAQVPIVPTPDDLIVVVAGGRSYFASVLPGWGPFGGFFTSQQVEYPQP